MVGSRFAAIGRGDSGADNHLLIVGVIMRLMNGACAVVAVPVSNIYKQDIIIQQLISEILQNLDRLDFANFLINH